MQELRQGDRGQEVRLLQKGLTKFTNAGTSITTFDGDFGPATKNALIQYQRENRLNTSGVYDQSTQNVLGPLIDRTFITQTDFTRIAQQFSLEPAALMAVYEVESKGDGFLTSGKCVILFEGHIFYRLYKDKYSQAKANQLSKQYPTIVYPTWVSKYYLGGTREHIRLNTAANIDTEIAFMSASWGLFQIMGFNHRSAGFSNVFDYVDAMNASEKNQLIAGCNFIRSNANMYRALQNHNWAEFARRYNGSAYAQNQYDVKLARAYNKYR